MQFLVSAKRHDDPKTVRVFEDTFCYLLLLQLALLVYRLVAVDLSGLLEQPCQMACVLFCFAPPLFLIRCLFPWLTAPCETESRGTTVAIVCLVLLLLCGGVLAFLLLRYSNACRHYVIHKSHFRLCSGENTNTVRK